MMTDLRQCRFSTYRLRRELLALLLVGVSFSIAKAEESSSSILNWLHYAEDVAGQAEWDQIQLVQGVDLAPVEQGTSSLGQPVDSGDSRRESSTLVSADALDSFASILNSQEATLPSNVDTNLNSPVQVERLESLTQRVEVTAANTAPLDIVPASTFALASAPDATETLTNVATTQTVRARKRSPISFDPRIRGYYNGQIYTSFNGAFHTPVRGDLDAVFSKVDQSLIGNVQVISGPYGVQYGSAFSYLITDTIPTPRYEDGSETHVRLGTQVRTNGGQTYNTATLYGGDESSGYFVNTGYRKGSDYRAGDGLDIPSSYDAFNLFGAVGRDVDKYTKRTTQFSFVDQGQTEYAGQFFDVDRLHHYGINHSLIHQNDGDGEGYRIDLWANNTSFDGDTDLPGKRRNDFAVLNRVDIALAASQNANPIPNAVFKGDVDGDLTSLGARAGATRDLNDDVTIGGGTDFSYVQQRLREFYDVSEFQIPALTTFNTGMPTSESFAPGIYAEGSLRMTSWWEMAVGSRVDFTTTQAAPGELRFESNFRDVNGNIIRDLDSYDTLASAFVSNDFEINRHWQARIGTGYAERVPNLTDRYSDGLFLAIIQSGFSRVNGNPELDKERNFQVDARLDADYEFVRCRFSAFHAWISDYVTYAANEVTDPSGARLLQAVNTDLATLAGFETYGEVDMTDGIQVFAGLAYLDGRDREIDRPLGGIYPLESRIGVRLSDVQPENRWGLEWGWQIVDNQDRLGTFRPVSPATEAISLETETPGYATSYLRAYARPTDRVSITGGIENLFDRNYFDHLALRLPATADFGDTVVLSPGITPYVGVEIDY